MKIISNKDYKTYIINKNYEKRLNELSDFSNRQRDEIIRLTEAFSRLIKKHHRILDTISDIKFLLRVEKPIQNETKLLLKNTLITIKERIEKIDSIEKGEED